MLAVAVDFGTTEVIHKVLEKVEFHFLMVDGDKMHLHILVLVTVVLAVVDPLMEIVVDQEEVEVTPAEVELMVAHQQVVVDHSSQEHMVKQIPQQFQAVTHFQQNQHQI